MTPFPRRSQAPIRCWISAGNTFLGMTVCTALGGIELYAEPVWLAYWVTRKLNAMLASAYTSGSVICAAAASQWMVSRRQPTSASSRFWPNPMTIQELSVSPSGPRSGTDLCRS